MPNLNYEGPEGKGPKTGRKLGNCNKTNCEKSTGRLGIGQGKHYHEPEADGRGKRLQYNLPKQ